MEVKQRTRLELLDALRGLTLISMTAYHGMWNLVHLYGMNAPWFRGTPGYLWQQSICWTFILLSGFCFGMGRHHLKRGLLVFGGGVLVSLVTHLVLPAARITCGVLTFLGSAGLLMIPAEKVLKKVPPSLGLLLSAALFFLLRNAGSRQLGFEGIVLGSLPEALYQNLLTAWLGFPPRGFWSADYFPMIPWGFLYLAGWFLYRLLHDRGWDTRLFAKGRFPVLNFLGRHSLLVYLLHQPLVYGIMMLLV